jgi:hypothetical protein
MRAAVPKRCGSPKPSHLVRVRIDLSALLELIVPPRPLVCHPVPGNWVAKSVAIRLPTVLRSLRSTKMGCFEVTKALFAILLSISVASGAAAPHSNANMHHKSCRTKRCRQRSIRHNHKRLERDGRPPASRSPLQAIWEKRAFQPDARAKGDLRLPIALVAECERAPAFWHRGSGGRT